MSLKEYLIQLTVDCEQLTAIEKAEMISAFNEKYDNELICA